MHEAETSSSGVYGLLNTPSFRAPASESVMASAVARLGHPRHALLDVTTAYQAIDWFRPRAPAHFATGQRSIVGTTGGRHRKNFWSAVRQKTDVPYDMRPNEAAAHGMTAGVHRLIATTTNAIPWSARLATIAWRSRCAHPGVVRTSQHVWPRRPEEAAAGLGREPAPAAAPPDSIVCGRAVICSAQTASCHRIRLFPGGLCARQ